MPSSDGCFGCFLTPSVTDKVIPRQLFEVPIQAAVGKKVVARETLSAVRADVTAGLYGGQLLTVTIITSRLLTLEQDTTSGR